jgi:NAD(P)-dependent dehydrogenase (short-subunit alcohol dehydrogenase family)
MCRLNGKVALVTGASRGIGLAISKVLSAEGALLILVGRERPALDRAAKQFSALPVQADVTRPRDVERLFRSVKRRYGRLDVLVNNAGVFTYKPFGRTTLDDWQANIATNLTSLFLTTQAALPLLARSRSAHLVNILSISSREAFPSCSAYCASKFGALGLTRVLTQELRPLGVRVTAILPGATDTRMMKEFGFPVRRSKLMQPDDVAHTVRGALIAPPRMNVEEIVLKPSRGSL